MIETLECPRSSWTYFGCTFFDRSSVAQVCRRSWKRIRLSPARSRRELKDRFLRLVGFMDGRVELGQVQAGELTCGDGRRGYVVSRGARGRKLAMVGRGREREPGSRPDPCAAFSGACVWFGASGAFVYWRTGQLSQSGHPPLQRVASRSRQTRPSPSCLSARCDAMTFS